MAHPTGTSARVQRLTSLVAILAVAVASGLAFGRIYQGRAATGTMIVAGLVSGAIAWAFERRSLLLATAVSAVALLFAVTWLVFPETTWYGLPSLDTLGAIADAAAQVGEEARVRVSPTEPIDPLVMAGLVGLWAAVFSCHALAFRAGSPLLALVPPLALIVFADSVLDEVVRPLFGVIFLVAGLAVVFADALRRLHGWGPIWTGPSRTTRLLPSTGRGARRIAAAAVVVAAIAPFVIPGFGAKAVIDISAVNRDDRVRVSPLVSVAAQLGRSEPIDVFEVASERPSYWRMTALENFDGIEWSPAEETEIPVSSGQELAALGTDPTTATFTILNDVGYDWLPVGTYPNSLEIDASASWAEETQTLRAAEPLDAGDAYTAVFSSLRPTARELAAEDFGATDVDPDLVQLPTDLSAIDEIEALAQEWTADATNDFERIMALQARFNDSAEFLYSLEVSPREDSEALLEFLTVSQRGFCQQFAAAMAVMLRTLDIPARVAVGYTAGEFAGESGVRRVRTDDLHAWVEVRFPSYGWLPFEPTPGRSNPTMATYGPGSAGGPGSDRDDGCPRRIATDPDCGERGTPVPPTPVPTSDPMPSGDLQGGASGPGRLGLPAIVAIVAALIVAIVAVAIPARRAWRRRRLIRRAGDEPRRLILASYDVFADRAAELGLPRGIGETPREYARRVTRDDRVVDGRVERLATLATRAAYAPTEPSRDDALDAAADAHVALQELADATPLRARIVGRLRLR